ncbi:FG-GAP-like repeat-containing protein [Rhodopirellula sallentina]|uniref:ASPIC/UnbV domain-containing protein n=1 Tax=Rhodopirellula sallentina SM41 TaxID=1263870 RepID=M5U7V9_9BACT|nr:FG-GAP-like repeat-containing protein [Rhodopirellula sallentina]EMI57530.1 ASPIC/UnbV domain-containing protein [Rhodopirellula sallentina SM41]
MADVPVQEKPLQETPVQKIPEQPVVVWRSPAEQRSVAIVNAEKLMAEGDFAKASESLQNWLVIEPDDHEVLFRLANVHAAGGNLERAIELLGDIPRDHPEAGLPALGQSADWCVRLQRYDEAEQRYRELIKRVPNAVPPRRQLAYLLNRQGRRHEAAEQIVELCRRGDVHQDELHALVILTDAMYDDPSRADELEPGTLPYWPIGRSGEARRQFALQRYDDVIETLHEAVDSGEIVPAASALYGRAVAEAQDDARFQWWLARIDPATREFADYWAAIGAYESRHRRYPEAVRALAEAVWRDPTDFISIGRLRQPLIALEHVEIADRWNSRWSALQDAMKFNNQIAESDEPNVDAIAGLAESLARLDRPLEAVLWKILEAGYRDAPAEEVARLNAERRRLVSRELGATGRDRPQNGERLCGLELDDFPMPSINSEAVDDLDIQVDSQAEGRVMDVRFVNVAERTGLDHTYEVADTPVIQQFSIHQTLGGGVAVIDFDLDGAVDLAFAQGGADPPAEQSDRSNLFIRNVDQSWVDVTGETGTRETQYSLGMTSGDWNQDGFPDLVVSNIGADTLFINNGDGSFERNELSNPANFARVPSSIAMADLSGDDLPDLFQCVYVDDPEINRKPPLDGSGRVVAAVSPGEYHVGADTVIVNDGEGGFCSEPFRRDNREQGYALGVVIADLDGVAGNEVFVGNDLTPNQLWTRDHAGQVWRDVATMKGCAFDGSGVATGSMGIAIGDFDSNGATDIHISNYENQSSSLFLSDQDAYQDRSVAFGLAGPTRRMVGFGSQAIDFDNDADLDLVVANGHLDDSTEIRVPFLQPTQLLANSGAGFSLVEMSRDAEYWQASYLGRGLARLDFDRDGRNDFVVTHTGQPSALLVNETPTKNHWLQVQLVGTESERDAIGSRVTVKWGNREAVQCVASGDGYLSRNENVVSFGLGTAIGPLQVLIRWPDGRQQVHHDVNVDQRVLVVENESEYFKLW